jgi:anti-anti-sigma factor
MHDGRFLIELTSGVPVVAAPEEIDMANAAELELALQEAAANGPGTLVADLTLTRFCDSSGIRSLLAAHQRAQADGGELLLVVPDAAVLRVFAIIGIDRLIPHFTSLDDAVAQSRPAQSQVGLNPG